MAIRQVSAVACNGDSGPSVMAISEAPRERANSIASMEREVYLGKEMPISRSPSPMRASCSNTSLTPEVTTWTLEKMKRR